MVNKTKIRFPSRASILNPDLVTDKQKRYWDEQKKMLQKEAEKRGFEVLNGTGDHRISLTDSIDGVHAHNNKYDSFVSFGIPTKGELMKSASRFVGIQVKDPHMHLSPGMSFNDTEKHIMKPNLFYLPDDMPDRDKNAYVLQHEGWKLKSELGSISGDINNYTRVVKTPEELFHYLKEKVPMKEYVHDKNTEIEVDEELLKIGRHYLDENILSGKKSVPQYGVVGYTSASPRQTEEARKSAYEVGKHIADRNFLNITGGGNTGLMLELVKGTIENGGVAHGVQCPYIARVEWLPKLSILTMVPEIYSREAVMFKDGEAYLVGAGGVAGAGTDQEAYSGLYLTSGKPYKSERGINREYRLGESNLVPGKKMEAIFDNRNGIFSPVIEIFKQFGLEEGRDFFIGNNNKEVLQHLDHCYEKTMSLASKINRTNHGGMFLG